MDGESGRPSGREQPMGEEWGEALPLELSRSKSFGCSFKIGPIESLAEDGYLFVWLWLVVNDRKFSARTVFLSHEPVNSTSSRTSNETNQPTEQAVGWKIFDELKLIQMSRCQQACH